MMRRLALLLALAASACAPRTPQSHADAVTEAVCRQRAEQVFQMRNPDEVYREDTYTSSLRDAPFGTSGSPSLPTRGLSSSYEWQQLIDECLRSTGGPNGIGPTPAAPPLAAPTLAAPTLAAPSPSP